MVPRRCIVSSFFFCSSSIADSLSSFGWLSGVAQVLRTAWSENPVLLAVGGIGLVSGLAGRKTRSCPRPFFVFLGITAAMNILYFATYTRFFEPIFLIHLFLALAVGMACFLGRTIHFGKGRILVAVLIVGLLWTLSRWRYWHRPFPVAEGATVAPWSFGYGMGVLVRCLAVGLSTIYRTLGQR